MIFNGYEPCRYLFDEKLCQEIPEIDVIFGSHTHHHFEHGEINNGVLMAAAGKYGYYLVKLILRLKMEKSLIKSPKFILLKHFLGRDTF